MHLYAIDKSLDVMSDVFRFVYFFLVGEEGKYVLNSGPSALFCGPESAEFPIL